MMYGWGGGAGWAWWMWLVMAVAFVAFWAVVVFGAVAVVRSIGQTRDHPRSGGGGDAEAILRERLARGEIDEEEYRKRLGVLRESP